MKGKLNGLSLFSGYGGIDLALSEYVRPIMYCDIERYAQAILLSRMDDESIPFAPIWNDVTTLDGTKLKGLVDIIYGGFPCQDISVAGNGAGLEGKRSGLFKEIVRLCKEASPQFIFLENVPAIRTRGAVQVQETLASIGYDTRWFTLSAAEVGANHKRERWFCLANSSSKGLEGIKRTEYNLDQDIQWSKSSNGPTSKCSNDSGVQENLPNTDLFRHGEQASWGEEENNKRIGESNGWTMPSPLERDWWSSESNMGGVLDGFTSWLDKNKCHYKKMAKRIALYEETNSCEEVLFILQQGIESKKDGQEISRECDEFQEKKLLQSLLCHIKEGDIKEIRTHLQGQKVPQEELRGMWLLEDVGCSSYRPKKRKQYSGEYSDTLQLLSQFLAYDTEEAWIKYCRENATYYGELFLSRITKVGDFRAERIKALGNGVVPLQAKTAFEILLKGTK